MRDVERRAGEFRERALEVELELPAQIAVERRERLVEHYYRGVARHYARERDALLLPARELRGVVLFEPGYKKFLRYLAIARLAVFAPAASAPEDGHDVLLRRHVGEERVILEEQAASPLLRLEVDAALRVEEGHAVYDDFALVGRDYPRYALERHAFAAAGAAEQREDFVLRLEIDAERESAELFAEFYERAHLSPPFSNSSPIVWFAALPFGWR